MTKKKGQGFARRVTLDNLNSFAPLLGRKSSRAESNDDSTDDGSSGDRQSRKRISADPALRAAESLFQGEPIKLSITFKPLSTKKSRSKGRKRKQAKRASAVAIGSPAKGAARASSHFAVSAARGAQLWEKVLSRTDAQRPENPNTNPTGNLHFTQEKWEEAGKAIDHTTYFRNLFRRFRWKAKNPKVEEAKIPFDVTILGKHYGTKELTVSHKPTGEAGQRNYTTGLHWGELMPLTREINLTGKTFKLYGPPKGAAQPFFIEIV